MNCAKTRALLDLHLEGRLPEAQSRAIDEHLKTCSDCSRLARSLRPAKAEAAPMPAELKEKLRRSLLAAPASPERPAVEVKEPFSALFVAAAALIMLPAVMPLASLIGAFDPGAGLGCALMAGGLVACGALVAHGLLTGRWTAARRQLPALSVAAAVVVWHVCAGALGPAFELPGHLVRATGPALFIAAALALGGAGEAFKTLKTLGISAFALVCAALLTRGRAAATIEADSAAQALIALLALATVAEGVRAARELSRRGARDERAALLGLLGAAAGCALASAWLMPRAFATLAWIAAGAAFGLTGLAGSGEPLAAAAVPLGCGARRGLSLAFAAGLAALALFPARWLSDDFRVAGAQRLAALSGSESDVLSRVDGVLRTSPSWPEAQLMAADALLAQGRTAGSLARLALVESAAPELPGLAYRQGLAYEKLENYPRALACYQRERALEPAFVPNLERLAVAAKLTGDFELARKTALTVIALEPKDPAHWLALSDIALRQSLAEKARRKGERHVRRPQAKKKASL